MTWSSAETRPEWPGWRIEYEGTAVGRDWHVGSEDRLFLPLPDEGGLVMVDVRRAVHQSTGSSLEDRWDRDTYRRTYLEGAQDPSEEKHRADARRILDGLLPTKPGRPAGGAITLQAIFAVMVDECLASPDHATVVSQEDVAEALHCDARVIRRAAPYKWSILAEMVRAHVRTLDLTRHSGAPHRT